MSTTEFDQRHDHDEAFFVPAHGLFADWEAASGCVRLSDDFHHASTLAQLRILGDWNREMAMQQAAAFVALFNQVTPALGALGLSEQIAHFRHICEDEGVDCPDEMVTLLRNSAQPRS